MKRRLSLAPHEGVAAPRSSRPRSNSKEHGAMRRPAAAAPRTAKRTRRMEAEEAAPHTAVQHVLDAVRAADHAKLRECLARGEAWETQRHVNAEHGPAKWTPLHWGAFLGHHEAVALLLQHGANVHAESAQGWTPLYCAALHGHSECIEALVRAGARPFAKTVPLETAAHAAAYLGPPHALQSMMRASNADLATLQTPDASKDQLIHKAAASGQRECVAMLLKAGVDVEAPGALYWTPVTYAARHGHLELLQDLLLVHRARVTFSFFSPAHAAAWGGHVECLRFLLDCGISPCGTSKENWTPAHYAARHGNLACLRLLLDRGAEVDARNKENWAPTHFAARNGHIECLRLLLDRGAALEPSNDQGWSPLHYAARYDHLACVRLFIERGGALELRTSYQYTPLHLAAFGGNLTVVQYLLREGANPNTSNSFDNNTVAHSAANCGHIECFRALVQSGANVLVEHADSGKTALDVLRGKVFGRGEGGVDATPPPPSTTTATTTTTTTSTATAATAGTGAVGGDADALCLGAMPELPPVRVRVSELFNNPRLSDVVFVTSTGERLYAHKAYICGQSEYFRSLFLGAWSLQPAADAPPAVAAPPASAGGSGDGDGDAAVAGSTPAGGATSRSDGDPRCATTPPSGAGALPMAAGHRADAAGRTEVAVRGVDSKLFTCMLRYMYTGELQPAALGADDVFGLWQVADRYAFDALCVACETLALRMCARFARDHSHADTLLRVYTLAVEFDRTRVVERTMMLVMAHYRSVREHNEDMAHKTLLHILGSIRLCAGTDEAGEDAAASRGEE